jgi:DNA-binding response OmpR family regulator
MTMTGIQNSAAKRVLLVDDDAMLCDTLMDQLLQEGIEVIVAHDCGDARLKAASGNFDFLILDVGLPDGDGRALCRELRDGGVACPILLLTGADSDADQIAGFDSGADDYIVKPFRFNLLMARMTAHMRNRDRSEEASYRIGPYTFRPSAKLMLGPGGEKIRLTEKETSILKFLYRNGGTVPRETLLHEVWGYNPTVTTHTLETHIYRLRQKIETNPGSACILITESGGYRLMV